MRIGIISDSHDNLDKLNIAVDVFNANKISLVLHAGDYVAPFAVSVLNRLKMPYFGVYGNNDGEKEGLSKMSQGRIKEAPLRIIKGGKKIVVAHSLSDINFKKNNFDLVVYGHSHKAEIYKEDRAVFINPGECCGWLTGKATIAICNLADLTCHILQI